MSDENRRLRLQIRICEAELLVTKASTSTLIILSDAICDELARRGYNETI